MAISDEIVNLTSSVNELTEAVNVRKQVLNEKVADAVAEANRADAEADRSKSEADRSRNEANRAVGEANRAGVEADRAGAEAANSLAHAQASQGFRDDAVAVVTSGEGSIVAQAGKFPVADADAKIDFDYLDLAETLASVAASTVANTVADYNEYFEQEEEFATLAKAITKNSKENLLDFYNERFQNNQLSHIDEELSRLAYEVENKEDGIPAVWKGLIEQDFLVDGFASAYNAEIMRGMGGSGFYMNRNYSADDGFSAKHRPFVVTNTVMFQHNHPNYYRMIGLGEQSAIVNGYYVRTTHNDPRLVDQDDAELNAPAVPADVLAKPTGVTLNPDDTVSIDTAGDTQAKYMRNIFTDHLDDCHLDLLYMEVWIQRLPTDGAFDDYSLSFRHSENADTLRELLNSAEKLNFSGAKDRPENGSFRCGIITFVDDEGIPEYAFVTYRLRAKAVGKPSERVTKSNYTEGDVTPELNFGVVGAAFGGTHGHALEVPLTADEMNSIIAGTPLFVETSYGKSGASPEEQNHSHLWEIRARSDKTLTGTSIGARGVTAPSHTFLAVDSDYTPVITSYRQANGTYSNTSVIWDTSVQPHVHPLDVKTIQDRFPFDLYKAVNHIIDNTNRYKLVKDTEALGRLRNSNPNAGWKELAESRYARFHMEQNDMISICESVWGLDGSGAYIPEEITAYQNNYETYETNGGGRLNMAKYNRTYSWPNTNDAAGRSTSRRGFSDPTLFVAKTTNPDVVEGYSWMIPMELIVRTPVEVWNPWDLVLIDGRPNNSNSSGTGTKANPWNAAFTQLWYNMLPPNFFNIGVNDVADTSSGGMWIMSNDGNAYPADNSGLWVSYSNGADYRDAQGNPYSTVFRQRIVIAPVWHEFTYANQQLENFKDNVRDALKGVLDGTYTDADIDNII